MDADSARGSHHGIQGSSFAIDGRPIRALVVDDEQTRAELVSMALRYEGWEIRAAGSGNQ